MLKIDFYVKYQSSNEDGSVSVWQSYNPVEYNPSLSYRNAINHKTKLAEEFSAAYKNDPNFKIISIWATPGEIDWDLMERMQAVREMCELGRKVRANTGIRNRQPLGKAYVAFSDPTIQAYMLYTDCGKREFTSILEQELNVLDLKFMDDSVTKQIFNYNLKPNFKALGPKGYGKQAQLLKASLQAMSMEEKGELHAKLKVGQEVHTHDIPLTIADVEVEFSPKEGFTSSTGGVGAIVLDTAMTDTLLELGLVAEFRSAVQNLRKEAGLDLTDRIFMEVYCLPRKANILEKYSNKLIKDLVASDMDFFPHTEVNPERSHRLYFDGDVLKTESQLGDKLLSSEPLYVSIYKEGSK